MFVGASFQRKAQKIDLNNPSNFINAILTWGGDDVGACIT